MKQIPAKQDKPTFTHGDALQVAARALRELSQFGFARRHWLSFRIAAQFLDRAAASGGADAVGRACAAGCGCDAPPLGNTGGTLEGRA